MPQWVVCSPLPRPDSPRSLREFQKRFADEEACRRYLAASRWPDGFYCPRCNSREVLDLPARVLWRCKDCGRDTSVTAATVLHRTPACSLNFVPDGVCVYDVPREGT